MTDPTHRIKSVPYAETMRILREGNTRSANPQPFDDDHLYYYVVTERGRQMILDDRFKAIDR